MRVLLDNKVLKDSEAEDLVRAIRAAARARRSSAPRWPPVCSVRAPDGRARAVPGPDTGERNVLRLMARGLTNTAIAGTAPPGHAP